MLSTNDCLYTMLRANAQHVFDYFEQALQSVLQADIA